MLMTCSIHNVNVKNIPEKCLCYASGTRAHPEHDAVLDVEQDLLLLTIVSDEGVERVAVRYPANQARVGGQRDHGIALDANKR